MKIVHISPTYFDSGSVIGGGERYPTELALWMSRSSPTCLVSFSNQERSYRLENLDVRIMRPNGFFRGEKINPRSFPPAAQISAADIVHVHHFSTMVSDLSALWARLRGKKTFVTDYGGGGSLTLGRFFPAASWYRGAIAYSSFGRENLPGGLRKKSALIPGGIDLERFRPPTAHAKRERKILCVGRILPHKGIHHVIEAFKAISSPHDQLVVIGRAYNERYFDALKKMAAGFPVRFESECSDSDLIGHYQTARATVLASSYTDYFGESVALPELMGFTLLESQACGTPAICTRVGGMPEFIQDGQTGFVCRDGSVEDLSRAFRAVLNFDAEESDRWAIAARSWIERFGWERVVRSHLELYSQA